MGNAHDPARAGLLLEALGPSLATTSMPVPEQLEHLAAALAQVWTIPAADFEPPSPGQDKASSLARLVVQTDARLGHPCPPALRELALTYAGRRAAAHDPARCVPVHGDPHPANALAVPEPGPGGLAYRLVDPDGFLADPGYDLGVALREWTGSLGAPPGQPAARPRVDTAPRSVSSMAHFLLDERRAVYLIVVKFQTKPEWSDRWLGLVDDFTRATRAEPGNLWFEWSRSVTDPAEFVLLEAFTDDGAEPHVSSDHFQTAMQQLPQALASTPKIISRQVEGEGWGEMGEMTVDPAQPA